MTTRLAFQLGLSAVLIGTPLALVLFAKVAERIDAAITKHRREWVRRHRPRPDSRDTLEQWRRINGTR